VAQLFVVAILGADVVRTTCAAWRLSGALALSRSSRAAAGRSRGGYISAFITTFSGRVKAALVVAGLSDWMTCFAESDLAPFPRPRALASAPGACVTEARTAS
jgi:hypothetical protein